MRRILWLAVIAIALTGCGKKDLDRETAMRLLQGRVVETIWLEFLNTATDVAMPNYQTLMNAGVLNCQFTPTILGGFMENCRVGPKGNGITGGFKLQLPGGNLVPSAVTGIAKTGENSATAQVALLFQPTPLYAQYQNAFDQIDVGINFGPKASARRLRNSTNATFQRFDDGWRVQSIQ